MKVNTQPQKPVKNNTGQTSYKNWLKNRHVKELLGINDAVLKQYLNLGLIESYQPYKGANHLYNPEDVEQFVRKNK